MHHTTKGDFKLCGLLQYLIKTMFVCSSIQLKTKRQKQWQASQKTQFFLTQNNYIDINQFGEFQIKGDFHYVDNYSIQ